MKLLTALLIIFALFVRSGPLCAKIVVPMSMTGADRANMGSGSGQPRHDSHDMTPACHTCLLAQLSEPPMPQPSACAEFEQVLPVAVRMDETVNTPPKPPPRTD